MRVLHTSLLLSSIAFTSVSIALPRRQSDRYTGQLWLPEVGMWYYKARMYSPTLGRFMQSDPIGYADGMNWYNYVGSDPVNFVDPLGSERRCFPAFREVFVPGPRSDQPDDNDIIVNGGRYHMQEYSVCGEVGSSGTPPGKPSAPPATGGPPKQPTPPKKKWTKKEVCKFLLDNIGTDLPASIMNEIGTELFGTAFGAIAGDAMAKLANRNLGEIGAVVEKGGAGLKRASMMKYGGFAGFFAGFAAGEYFGDDIEGLIDEICGN